MNPIVEKIRRTKDEKAAGFIRIFVGMIFLMTGLMKLFVPMAREAWLSQLTQSGLPFSTITYWVFPFAEIATAVILFTGFLTRIGSLVVMGSMLSATYVHIAVHDPTLFPFQPSEPIVPLIVFLMGAFVLWRGGGAWSLDLKTLK